MNNQVGLVYKKGVFAATLSSQGGSVKFQYDHAYLASAGRPVASTLPLATDPLVLNGGAAPAFFSGLLPEGRRLLAISSRIKTSIDDDLGLLLEIGADLIGDVQVLAKQADQSADRETLWLPRESKKLNFSQIREQYFGSKASGVPGVQDKVSSKMLNARARWANVDYILKLNPVDVPFAVENEGFFLSFAKRCGIKTATNETLIDQHGEHALLLQRFDRVATNVGKTRLAAEDGCQVANLYPAAKYNIDFIEMAQNLIALCPAKSIAGLSLFNQLVFNWLIGNGDAHAKNFSVLESTTGEWKISPAYDLLCTRFYDDRNMALSLNGNDSDWSRSQLIAAAEQLLVPKKAAEKVLDKQLQVLRDLPDQIISGALPFRRDQNFEVAAFLKQRARAIA